ncbi:hypothetical protein ABZ851_36780 [Streptomyces sp. NPDC047049]|uniref:hypothetical protein n=1 Tax=Streptomyces sp. NPDC047049 TaxID=3156688 RepID=UPI0033BFE596
MTTADRQPLAEVLHASRALLAAERAVRTARQTGDHQDEAAVTARLTLWQADLLAAAAQLAAAWDTPRARATAPHYGTNVANEMVTAMNTLTLTGPDTAESLRQRADQAAALAELPPGETAAATLAELRTPPAAAMPVLAAAVRLYWLHGAPGADT